MLRIKPLSKLADHEELFTQQPSLSPEHSDLTQVSEGQAPTPKASIRSSLQKDLLKVKISLLKNSGQKEPLSLFFWPYMQKMNFSQVVETLVQEDNRYDAQAYTFVREGLDYTMKRLRRGDHPGDGSHVSAQELLEGLRDYALEQFGPMSKLVLAEMGIHQCIDFGHIVFHLVRFGVLGKKEGDSIEDFVELWSFDQAFVQPFLPLKEKKIRRRPPRKASQGSRLPGMKPSSLSN